ncbi:hypothetical protein CR513_32391, partial [Mucuna pruriens]
NLQGVNHGIWFPTNQWSTKKTTTAAVVGGSGTPIPSVGYSNAMFKITSQNIDIAWKWNNLKDKSNKKSVTCDFCLKTSTGGIIRAKRHQLGIRRDVGACRKILEDIRLESKASFKQKKAQNEIYMEGVQEDEDEENEVEEIVRIKSGKRPTTSSMNEISSNVARPNSFKLMIEAARNYGPHLKSPSYHELRVPFLKKEFQYTKDMLKGYEEERMKYGCSIMSYG